MTAVRTPIPVAIGVAPAPIGPRRTRAIGIERLNRPEAFQIALFLLVLQSVSRFHQVLHLEALRPGLLLAGLACVCMVLEPKSTIGANLLRSTQAKLLVALGVQVCLSALFGISLGSAASYIVTDYSRTLIFGFLLCAAIRHAADLRLFNWAFVIACALLVWMAVFIFGLSAAGSMMRLGDLYTYDANDLGCVLVVGLPLTLLAFQTAGRLGKLFSLVVLVGIGLAVARSGSRGAFVGLLVVGAALLVLVPHVSVVKRLVFLTAVGSALALSAPAGYWQQMQTILKPTDDYNWSARDGRREIAKRGISYMMAYPVFGVGIHNFGRAEGTISEKARRHVPGTGIVWTAPHNSFIQIGAETGIPGLAIWSSILLGGIVGLIRLRRRLPRQWARGDPEQRFIYFAAVYVPIALIGFSVTCAFLSFAYLDPIYILAALTAGVFYAAEGAMQRSSVAIAPPAPSSHRRGSPPATSRNLRQVLTRGGLSRGTLGARQTLLGALDAVEDRARHRERAELHA